MSTLGELVERITDCLAKGGLFNMEVMEAGKVRDLLIDCRTALAAALAAEGQGDEPRDSAEMFAEPNSAFERAAAPSLHKEELDFGTAEEVIAGLDAINKHNAALHKEGARCNYYFGGFDGGNRCQLAKGHSPGTGHIWRVEDEAASPAGRAEQVSGSTGAAKDGDAQ